MSFITKKTKFWIFGRFSLKFGANLFRFWWLPDIYKVTYLHCAWYKRGFLSTLLLSRDYCFPIHLDGDISMPCSIALALKSRPFLSWHVLFLFEVGSPAFIFRVSACQSEVKWTGWMWSNVRQFYDTCYQTPNSRRPVRLSMHNTYFPQISKPIERQLHLFFPIGVVCVFIWSEIRDINGPALLNRLGTQSIPNLP